MSTQVGAATGKFQNTSAAPVANVPITLAGWVKVIGITDPSVRPVIQLLGGTLSQLRIDISHSAATIRARAYTQTNAGTQGIAASAGALSLNTWYHLAATFPGIAERNIFVNGANDGTNTDSRTVADMEDFAIGDTNTSSDFKMADVAVWDVELTDEEIARLALGYSARFVRPDSLTAYGPLVHGAAWADPYGLFPTMSASGTPAAGNDHPPILGAIAV